MPILGHTDILVVSLIKTKVFCMILPFTLTQTYMFHSWIKKLQWKATNFSYERELVNTIFLYEVGYYF